MKLPQQLYLHKRLKGKYTFKSIIKTNIIQKKYHFF